jgi:hypothetical protein
MMTRTELKAAQSIVRPQVVALYLLSFFIWAGSLAVYWRYEAELMTRLSAVAHWAVILGIIFGWNLFFLLIDYLVRKLRERWGLACPTCGCLMVGTAGMAVIATGVCGRCGKQVLDEDSHLDSAGGFRQSVA